MEQHWIDPLDAPPAPAGAGARFAYLDALNPQQRQAVETLDGPVLVLAGAGTGKTRVLTTRLAHLLNTRRAFPNQILAVTFTNKAAREMRERVASLLGQPVEGWWLGTFHALAARVLRRYAELVGLKSNFSILDTDDQIRLLKQVMEAESVDGKSWPARLILSTIERWKDRGLTPDQLKPEDAGDIAGGRLVTLYRRYQDRLRTLNACDFGDLLLHNLILFKHVEETPDGKRYPVLEALQARFRYLLVDEYQDTNVAQYLWLRALAAKHRNIACVGDDDQSIYSWRGAEVGNILRFETDFPGAVVVRLEHNYRSTGHILAAASGMIAHNQGRLGKTLFTDADQGEPISVHGVWDSEEEARTVGEEIEDLQRRGAPLNQIAVLVRAGFQMRAFEERFITLGLPYRVIGGPRFYERAEIRDALAYLRVIHQPDDDLAFERIVNVPKRGLGAATLKLVNQVARARGVPLTVAIAELVDSDELKPKPRTALRSLLADFVRWRDLAATGPHPDLAGQVLDESGYTGMWQADKSPEAQGRLENLKELVTAMGAFDSLGGFLEHVSLVMDANEQADGDKITLMTLHAAKGLEFDNVFLPGWEEGVFPNQRAMDETGVAGLEEERRLAYVGLTRARRHATVLHAANRQIRGQWQSSLPSRFVDELPEPHHEVKSSIQGGGGSGLAEAGFGYRTGGSGARLDWERLRSRAAGFASRRPPVIDDAPYTVAPRSRPDQEYAAGARVFHQKFGYGTVRTADAGKLTIDFDQAGEKRVMDSFVVPADRV